MMIIKLVLLMQSMSTHFTIHSNILGYHEMGRKGGLSTMDKSGEERAQEEAIDIDESKFRTGNNQDKNQNK